MLLLNYLANVFCSLHLLAIVLEFVVFEKLCIGNQFQEMASPYSFLFLGKNSLVLSSLSTLVGV